jgi:hypothetical protein
MFILIEEESKVNDQELEDETVASVMSGVDGQCIQEQLSIATVPTERNRLLRKLRVCYFSNNITCSLAEA